MKYDAMSPTVEQPADLFEGIESDALYVLALSEDIRTSLAQANRVARLRAWALSSGGAK